MCRKTSIFSKPSYLFPSIILLADNAFRIICINFSSLYISRYFCHDLTTVVYPGFFGANRQFVQFSISLRCHHGQCPGENFKNLSFWFRGNCLLESFFHTSCRSSLPSFLLSSELFLYLLALCPIQPLFSRDRKFCFRVSWLGLEKTFLNFTFN